MICVSIGRGRHKQMIAEHKHLVEQGAELVELRLDYVRTKVNLSRLLEGRPCPTLVTVRRERDGGRYTGDEKQRRVLLRAAIAHGVEYVDLEEDVAAEIPRFGATKRVISYHDFRKTPDDLEEIHARMAGLDADVVKLACIANHPQDNLRMLKLIQGSEVPTVGLCMGDIGTPSRILAGKFGAPFTYATFHHERVLAPGQLSFDDMRNVYRYDEINAETEVYGVIGDPIEHSLSPLVHNAGFRELGLNKVYVPFRVPRGDVDAFLEMVDELGIRGLSVTIPHKSAVLGRLTQMEAAVKGMGAANTIVFDGDEARGANTDYRGAMDALEEAVQRAGDNVENIANRNALVLGAGGAARAVAYGLKRRGASVTITSRSTENAERLADFLECGAVEWASRGRVDASIVVNCTPVGMHPKVDETPYDMMSFRPGSIVFDTVYNPENTLFVKEARERSCHVVTGVEMFLRQAALQFEMFTGQQAPAGLMRKVMKQATSAVKF